MYTAILIILFGCLIMNKLDEIHRDLLSPSEPDTKEETNKEEQ